MVLGNLTLEVRKGRRASRYCLKDGRKDMGIRGKDNSFYKRDRERTHKTLKRDRQEARKFAKRFFDPEEGYMRKLLYHS
jgi:hypothetical protein